jgi:hypothetical protein
MIMQKLYLVEWDDELGEDWLNVFNMELCLFSKEHTRRDLVTITDVSDPYANLPEGVERYPGSTYYKMLEEWAEEARERLENKDPNSLY